MLMKRLVYGCGRLTGGATELEAQRLIHMCLDHGLVHFDTAPSYGIGTAEVVLGKALFRARQSVVITTKVGSPRPRFSLFKTYLRKAKRTLLSPTDTRLSTFIPISLDSRAPNVGVTRHAIVASVQRSLKRLRREYVDFVFLHEVYAAGLTHQIEDAMEYIVNSGDARRVGYSTGSMLDIESEAIFPSEYAAQTAIAPNILSGNESIPETRTRFLHSVILTGKYLKERDKYFSEGLDNATKVLGSFPGSKQDREVATLLALANIHAPTAGIVFSATTPKHLGGVLEAVRFIDDNRLIEGISAAFRGNKPRLAL